jgi:hypothetical protein
MSTAIRDLTLAVSNLRTFLQGPYAPPPSSGAFAPSPPATTSHQGIPITQIRFPSSPSPLPAWLDAPVFTAAPAQPTVLPPTVSPSTTALGGVAGYADPYTGVSMVPNYAPPAAMDRPEGANTAAPHGQQPSHFTKLEFATYDGTVDPLNWLNQCD